MKKIIIISALLLNFVSHAESMRDMIDQIFEQQREMMDQMMNDDFFDSMDSFAGMGSQGNQLLSISSTIKKENGKNFEVVNIDVNGEASSFDVEVDQMIKVSAVVTQTQKTSNESFTSQSSSSQMIPIPENGIYRSEKTKRSAKRVSLYFEIPAGQKASQLSRPSPRLKAPSLDEPRDDDDVMRIIPERKT